MSEHAYLAQIRDVDPAVRLGHVRKIAPNRIVASGPLATVGDICEICRSDRAAEGVLAEVAAVDDDHIILYPLDPTAVVQPGATVKALSSTALAPAGDGFCGRAIDGLSRPIDDGGSVFASARLPIAGEILAPLQRQEPNQALRTGIRALDGLLTLGRGQRIGIFSASGVGKTTLVRQLAAQVDADHCVLCLVGERGREVEAAWRALSSRKDHSRFTCVAATSDQSAPLRVRAVHQALCLAEYWRDRGEHVLFVLDSVTRFAMALREIGLAAGAPPTMRAYTPNVFAALPRLVERCGARKDGGSISAVLTVLSETDDVDDPLVEIMKSLLDGHIILARQLAERGQFPPIDVVRSVSRQCEKLMSRRQAVAARRVIASLSIYDDARVMIESGLYKAGSNAQVDDAVKFYRPIQEFLRQGPEEVAPASAMIEWLERCTAKATGHA